MGGLTDNEMQEVFDLLLQLRRTGVTILVIEHVMRFMIRIADRILVMHQGRLIFDDAPSALAEDETVRAIYLGEKEAARLAAAGEQRGEAH